jgi:hypothetical protein
MMFTERGMEVLDGLSRELLGKIFLGDGHMFSGGDHRRSFSSCPIGRADNRRHSDYLPMMGQIAPNNPSRSGSGGAHRA